MIGMHAAGTEIIGVHAGAGHPLVEFHAALAFLEAPHRRRRGAEIEREGRDVQQVVQNAGEFGEQHADILRARRSRDLKQRLDAQREGMLLAHRRDVIEPVEIRHCLDVGLVLDQLFGAAMQQADMGIAAIDDFPVHLHDEAQARRAPPDAAARNSS